MNSTGPQSSLYDASAHADRLRDALFLALDPDHPAEVQADMLTLYHAADDLASRIDSLSRTLRS